MSCIAPSGHVCTGNVLVVSIKKYRTVTGGPSGRIRVLFAYVSIPAGQVIKAHEGEVTDWLWVAPRVALDEGVLTLVYATRAVLESVAGAASAAALFAQARRQREVPVVEPRLVQTESGWEVVR